MAVKKVTPLEKFSKSALGLIVAEPKDHVPFKLYGSEKNWPHSEPSTPMHLSAEDMLTAAMNSEALATLVDAHDCGPGSPGPQTVVVSLADMKSGSLPKEMTALIAAAVKEAIGAGLAPLITAQPAMTSFDKKEGVASIDIKHADGTTSTAQEKVTTPKLFTAPACNVGVSSKLTIPIAQYTNAQVSVSLNIPCTHGEIDQVYDFAKDWVDVRMTALKKQVDQAKGVSG